MSALYAWSYYGEFDINIFNFSGLSDFLLIAFSDLSTSIELFLFVLIFTLVLLFFSAVVGKFFGKGKPERPDVEKFQQPDMPQSGDSEGVYVILHRIKFVWDCGFNSLKFFFYSSFNYIKFAFLYLNFIFLRSLAVTIPLILIGPALLVPWYLGKWNSQKILEENIPYVEATFRQDVAHPMAQTNKHMLQLGVTSGFLFLYSHEEADLEDHSDPNLSTSVEREIEETSGTTLTQILAPLWKERLKKPLVLL